MAAWPPWASSCRAQLLRVRCRVLVLRPLLGDDGQSVASLGHGAGGLLHVPKAEIDACLPLPAPSWCPPLSVLCPSGKPLLRLKLVTQVVCCVTSRGTCLPQPLVCQVRVACPAVLLGTVFQHEKKNELDLLHACLLAKVKVWLIRKHLMSPS